MYHADHNGYVKKRTGEDVEILYDITLESYGKQASGFEDGDTLVLMTGLHIFVKNRKTNKISYITVSDDDAGRNLSFNNIRVCIQKIENIDNVERIKLFSIKEHNEPYIEMTDFNDYIFRHIASRGYTIEY